MLRGGRIFYGALTSFLSLCLTSILYLNTTIVVQTYHILVIVDMDENCNFALGNQRRAPTF